MTILDAFLLMVMCILCVLGGMRLERDRFDRLLNLDSVRVRNSLILRLKALCAREGITDDTLPKMDAQECLDYLEDYLLRGQYERESDPLRNNTAILTTILAYYSSWYQVEVGEAVKYIQELKEKENNVKSES